MSIYVDKEKITLKLQGRLKLDESADSFYPVEAVDETLIDDIIEEKEDYVNLILGQIYTLPLKRVQPTIRAMVENLVMADLLEYNFVNTTTANDDINNLANSFKNKAFNVLLQLTAGTNVVLPDIPASLNYTNMPNVRRMSLSGEELISQLPQTELVHRDIFVGSLNEGGTDSNYLEDEYGFDNPFSMDWGEDYRYKDLY